MSAWKETAVTLYQGVNESSHLMYLKPLHYWEDIPASVVQQVVMEMGK